MTRRLIALLVLLSVTSPASAYIDPASGSAIMSAVVGFFVAIGLAVKTYWYKIKGLFSTKSAAPENASNNTSNGTSNNKEAENGDM